MFSYDPTLRAAVDASPHSIGEVVQILQAIEATCADGDGLKWFNGLYLDVTRAVETRVNAGGFADPDWIAALDVEFAGFYFTALASSLSGGATPGCWQSLFSERSQPTIARIQFALAGMNAHINHDLPEAVVATCRTSNLTPAQVKPNQAALTAMRAEREVGLDLTTISTSCPSATRNCIKRSTEKPSSL